MASYGRVSSFRMVKRGLSHRFLESGASNLNTKASKLQNKTMWQKTKNQTAYQAGNDLYYNRSPSLTCPGCTALQHPCRCSTMSSLHLMSNSITYTEAEQAEDLDFCQLNIFSLKHHECLPDNGGSVHVWWDRRVHICSLQNISTLNIKAYIKMMLMQNNKRNYLLCNLRSPKLQCHLYWFFWKIKGIKRLVTMNAEHQWWFWRLNLTSPLQLLEKLAHLFPFGNLWQMWKYMANN